MDMNMISRWASTTTRAALSPVPDDEGTALSSDLTSNFIAARSVTAPRLASTTRASARFGGSADAGARSSFQRRTSIHCCLLEGWTGNGKLGSALGTETGSAWACHSSPVEALIRRPPTSGKVSLNCLQASAVRIPSHGVATPIKHLRCPPFLLFLAPTGPRSCPPFLSSPIRGYTGGIF